MRLVTAYKITLCFSDDEKIPLYSTTKAFKDSVNTYLSNCSLKMYDSPVEYPTLIPKEWT